MDGRRFSDDQEPQWYGGEPSWRTPAADPAQPEPEEDYRATSRPRRASDPLTDPTGYSDHWNAARKTPPEPEPEIRSRRGYEYPAEAALTGRGVEALPVVTPTSAVPDPDAGLTAAYPATGDIPRHRTEALDRSALRRPPADPGEPLFQPPADPGEPLFQPPVEPPVDAPVSGADQWSPVPPGGERVYSTRRPILAVPIAIVALILEIPALRLLVDGFAGGPDQAGHLITGLALALSLPLTGLGLYALFTTGRAADHRTWWRPPLAHLPLGLVLLIAAAIAAR